jgi:hypothetical protein
MAQARRGRPAKQKQEEAKAVEKKIQNEDFPTAILGSEIISPREMLSGKIISLNGKARSFFGVGSIWLTLEKYWAEVPNDLSDADYNLIYSALASGDIVSGKKHIPAYDKPKEVLFKYWTLVKESKNSLSMTAVNTFKRLIDQRIDAGWTPREVFEYCIEREEDYRGRDFIIRALRDLINYYDGPNKYRHLTVTDTEEEEVSIVSTEDGYKVSKQAEKSSTTVEPTPNGKASLDTLME